MKESLKEKYRIEGRKRHWRIYKELGFIPWKKVLPKKVRKQKDGVYMGTREAIIPFLNEDSKRTFSHLLLRPGYLMRDYIIRGHHERYMAPFTSLLVFYSMFSLMLAVVRPDMNVESVGKQIMSGFSDVTVPQVDSLSSVKSQKTANYLGKILLTMREALTMISLDRHPEAVDTPWKASLAAVEGDLRSKGIPLFFDNFFFLWLAMAIVLRKRKISVSGAAAASAYVLCQFCVFMFLALVLSFGKSNDLSLLVMALLLFVDYRQFLKLDNKPAFWLTVRTGIMIVILRGVIYLLLGLALVGIALLRV